MKSGEIVFGKKHENMHATTVQSVEPGPSLFINNESDFCSLVRQNKEQTEKSNSNLLQQIQVYGDDWCLFRHIASHLITTLLLCERNEGGMLLDPRLQKLETKLADTLRTDTVNTLKAKLHFLNSLDDALVQALCEKTKWPAFCVLRGKIKGNGVP